MKLGLYFLVLSLVALPALAAERRLSGSGASVGFEFYVELPNESKLEGTHAKVAGPEWLEVTADGVASGTPPREAAGENEFRIEVKPAQGEATTLVYPIFVRVIDDI